MFTSHVDSVLRLVYCFSIIGGILPVVFRRQLWLRPICIVLLLVSAFFAFGRVHVAPRMAVDRLQSERKTWTKSFRDGSLYTSQAASTALPIFALIILGLTAMTVFPPKSR